VTTISRPETELLGQQPVLPVRAGALGRHLLSAGDLDRDAALHILDTATRLDQAMAGREVRKLPTLRGRTVVNLFFEDSTRTRISFELAAKRLSADVINFSAKGSSVSKGESLKDTALTLQAMGADAVVCRHSSSGAPQQLSAWVAGHVINAGDGTHEHPTQALLDAFTLRRHLAPGGSLEGRRVVIVGDVLHSRVARSNVLLLSTLGMQVTLVAPPTLLPVGVQNWPAEVTYDLDSALRGADAVMMLPDRARVLEGLRPGLPPRRPARRARHRAAPGSDEPRHGDHPGGRRRSEFGDRGAGGQRRHRPDGRVVPAAHRRPGRSRMNGTAWHERHRMKATAWATA
jgi:aspartate carbamoyltransferase catalytic subunit